MGLLGGAPPTAGADSGRLFAAGVTYICCGAWPFGLTTASYVVRTGDTPTRYNLALCCFHVGWYEESYRLLAEAERLLDGTLCEVPCPGVRPCRGGSLPKPFRRWDAASELPRCPLLSETPRDMPSR